MISILTPARGRFDQTKDVIDSTYDLADYPDEVEMIWRVDEDDPDLTPRIGELKRYPNIKWIVGDKMDGYASLDIMVNEMAAESNGDLIGTWGNDAWFMDKGWDTQFKEWSGDDIAVIQIAKNESNGFATQFPFITRRVYNILGHYCQHTSIDDYISWVGIRAGCHYYSDVRVRHDHTEGDYIAEEKELRVSGEYDGGIGIQKSFWLPGTQKEIEYDSFLLGKAMNRMRHHYDIVTDGDKRLCDFYGWSGIPWK